MKLLYLAATISISLLLLLGRQNFVNGGRIEISVGKKWPWRRFYSSKGLTCTDIGPSLFDMPGINVATVQSTLDGGNQCFCCRIFKKKKCEGAFQNIGIHPTKTSIGNPESFRCTQRCRGCKKAQLAGK